MKKDMLSVAKISIISVIVMLSILYSQGLTIFN